MGAYVTEDGELVSGEGVVLGEQVVLGDEVGYFVPADIAGGLIDELSGEDDMGAVWNPNQRQQGVLPSRGRYLAQPGQYRAPFGRPQSTLGPFQPYANAAGQCNISAQSCGPSGRLLLIGFDSVAAVAAGASAIITQRPQVLFQPSRVVIPSTLGGFFIINDLKIGKNSQFTASGSVSALTFSELAVGVALAMDAAQIAQDIVISVTNIDAAPHRFLATMIGESCEGARLG